MQPEPTTLAYLAGVVDADGYVTATRSVRKGVAYYAAQVGITGSCREPHDLASEVFGGNVNAHSPGGERSHHRTQFRWQVGGTKAAPIIEALLPYLRIKRDRAILVLHLQEELNDRRLMLRENPDDPYPWAPAGYDPSPSFDALVEDIRSSVSGGSWDEYRHAVTA